MTYSKDIADIAKNINLQSRPQENMIVDDFAKNIINKVFGELALLFPAWKYNWKSDDPSKPDKVLNAAKLQWTKAFVENNISTMEQISHGFKKARQSDTDFLPSCGKFISWCNPSAEDMGYPSEQKALEQCIKHRNLSKMNMESHASHFIQTLCKCVNWFEMNTANGQQQVNKANQNFKAEYLHLIANYQKPVETRSARLETSKIVRDRMSPQQLEDSQKRGLDAMADIKRKLKLNNN